jgi:hypothetical protein
MVNADNIIGMTLDEIKNKYPPSFQPLGYDCLMDTDSMYKPKVISTFEMCVNVILTLLMMKPGQYPSIPELGINIEGYLMEYSDDPNIPIVIKDKIAEQCDMLAIAGVTVDVYFDKTSDGVDALVLEISGTERSTYGTKGNRVVIGISYNKLKELYIQKAYVE